MGSKCREDSVRLGTLRRLERYRVLVSKADGAALPPLPSRAERIRGIAVSDWEPGAKKPLGKGTFR